MLDQVPFFTRVILITSCCVTCLDAGFTLEQGIPHFNTKPYFLQPPARNITALEGQSAYLHCRVAQLGDKKVSWIRKRDLHVLTSGIHTFASDERFLSLHAERSENWTLHIRFSQLRDSGDYQCQVNTDPKISMLFTLDVKEAATLMDGSDQRYVRAGSNIQLTCKTSTSSQPAGLLYWYRDLEILQTGGRVNITTQLENETVSKLTIQGARITDSGNYTCWPTTFLPASVVVHVIPEEKAAANSQVGGSNGSSGTNGSGSNSNTISTAASSARSSVKGMILSTTVLLTTLTMMLLSFHASNTVLQQSMSWPIR